MESDKVLEIENLSTAFQIGGKPVAVTKDISFDIRRGEILGIVGESGSGKSVTAKTVMRLLPTPPSSVLSGTIALNGVELLNLSEREMEKIRGNKVAMIFQEPMTALNPVYTCGDQIVEVVRKHQKLSKKAAREAALEMLKLVGIPMPEQRMKAYPHELSGGQLQRVCIARAVACEPEIILFDEAISSLDAHTQVQVMDLLIDLKEKLNLTYVFITHDLTSVTYLCDEVLFLYRGHITECRPVRELGKTTDEYARRLLQAIV